MPPKGYLYNRHRPPIGGPSKNSFKSGTSHNSGWTKEDYFWTAVKIAAAAYVGYKGTRMILNLYQNPIARKLVQLKLMNAKVNIKQMASKFAARIFGAKSGEGGARFMMGDNLGKGVTGKPFDRDKAMAAAKLFKERMDKEAASMADTYLRQADVTKDPLQKTALLRKAADWMLREGKTRGPSIASRTRKMINS